MYNQYAVNTPEKALETLEKLRPESQHKNRFPIGYMEDAKEVIELVHIACGGKESAITESLQREVTRLFEAIKYADEAYSNAEYAMLRYHSATINKQPIKDAADHLAKTMGKAYKEAALAFAGELRALDPKEENLPDKTTAPQIRMAMLAAAELIEDSVKANDKKIQENKKSDFGLAA